MRDKKSIAWQLALGLIVLYLAARLARATLQGGPVWGYLDVASDVLSQLAIAGAAASVAGWLGLWDALGHTTARVWRITLLAGIGFWVLFVVLRWVAVAPSEGASPPVLATLGYLGDALMLLLGWVAALGVFLGLLGLLTRQTHSKQERATLG